jgi:Trk K+ transport system NAD-binding subunit
MVIGTSTNLLVSSIAEQHGQPPIGMFEMSSLGLIFFAAGVVYMLAVGVRLIPERRLETDLTEQYRMGEYLVDIILGETAASVGTRLAESPIVKELDIEVLDLIRNGVRTTRPSPDTVLQAGDQLRSLTSVESIAAMQERKGITLVPKAKWADAGTDRASLSLVEVAIAPFSTLEGRSMRDVQFAERFGAIVLAIRHHGRLLHDKLHDMPGGRRVAAGDAPRPYRVAAARLNFVRGTNAAASPQAEDHPRASSWSASWPRRHSAWCRSGQCWAGSVLMILTGHQVRGITPLNGR